MARVYSTAHGARLTHFLDRLLGLSDDRGRLLGVIGTELGRESNRFFLESYLDDPIEQVLSEKRGSRVDREELAEVGNLAGPCGMGSELVGTLAGELHRSGAKLVLVDRDADGLKSLTDTLGKDARGLVGDLANLSGLAALADQAIGVFGHLDAVINNAGVLDFAAVEDEDPGAIERLYRVNVVAPVLLSRQLVKHFRTRGEGRVVNVGSIFGSIGFAYFATYSSSKFAIRGFSEALRRELAGTGIGVTYVAPRATRTGLATLFGRMAEEVGMKMDEPETVARRIVSALRRDRKDVYLGFPESLFVRINAWFPRFVDRALRKQDRLTEPFAREATPPQPVTAPPRSVAREAVA